ncbi:unannotated protein [freshwater metagenome]|uniref:N-acetyl-gamma-glutamyl-phosphate reductase n=1 Tax=freshwater metagenome TaxID=449393 RepID=A0A6J6W536_9ZZZZ|nr:N-acetyl-gamma-glutamyl-phosphate reductase [Actinomycetota bacterium]MSV63240.1 N-acetyl-gamma-glutamyl-phosphate reductase [Actinomycetota bacterium]MSW33811.1 N-acetyl-gamma-glutamyl-phosphate reductase [Actinomycetota bacterium]MSX31499.1 N-acetyl-gamma-glutamyl-phosphate reductase [Actinomycetota bacterium]MSX52087.1 N-acetyl-gamma-glutamyl-phosphate reductase [Actinomycetota bacterium]
MKTAIIGASGYSGGELLKLIAEHPSLQASVVVAHSNAGELITALHPHLISYANERFTPFDLEDVAKCDLVFLALPHGESSKIVKQLPPQQLVVDLGADFRLENPLSWSTYYGGDHAGTWTYGLPELSGGRKKISESKKVANPGCYATAIALSCAPLLNVIEADDIVVVAASGTTGAGRSAKVSLLGSEVMSSLSSYKFAGAHQHTPEIEEALSRINGKSVKLSFTPILAPMPRGILATVTARLSTPISLKELRQSFESYYAGHEFVVLLPEGAMPRTSSVVGSNFAHIQCAIDTHTNRVVISTAIDNLGKGAASQAIQNANLMLGLAESTGLMAQGLGV